MAKPYNLSNEQIVLAAILQDEGCRNRALISLSPNVFFGKKHKVIFRAITKCVARNLEIDDNSIALHSGGEKFGGIDFLDNLRSLLVPVELKEHIGMMKRDFALIQAKEQAEELIDAIDDVDYSDAVKRASSILTSLRDVPAIGSRGGDSAETWIDDFEARRKGEKELIFVSTGYKPLDEWLTEGYAPGNMTVLAGRPRMGKTMFVVDSVKRLLRKSEKNILVVPLEKGRDYFLTMLASNLTGISTERLIKEPEEIDKHDAKRVKSALRKVFDSGRLVVADSPVRDLVRAGSWDNEQALDRMGDLLSSSHYDVAFWDLWQRALRKTDPDSISATLDGFYEIGQSVGTHNVIVQQVHRRAEDRKFDKVRRPSLIDLKQSGAYEEFADAVLFVHREKVFKRFSTKGDLIEIILSKQKLGIADVTMVADFKPQFCRLKKPRMQTAEDRRPAMNFKEGEI